ncbi:MAG: hypothetical protein AB7G80_06415 [Dongiaceae bacterium]
MSSSRRSFTIVGRYEDTGEVVINTVEVDGGDVHFEILRHWGEVTRLQPSYEILVVFAGEMAPAVTPETMRLYVERHFPAAIKKPGEGMKPSGKA